MGHVQHVVGPGRGHRREVEPPRLVSRGGIGGPPVPGRGAAGQNLGSRGGVHQGVASAGSVALRCVVADLRIPKHSDLLGAGQVAKLVNHNVLRQGWSRGCPGGTTGTDRTGAASSPSNVSGSGLAAARSPDAPGAPTRRLGAACAGVWVATIRARPRAALGLSRGCAGSRARVAATPQKATEYETGGPSERRRQQIHVHLFDTESTPSIAVTKRGKVIARIVPATQAKGRLRWPDSALRMKRLMSGATVTVAPASEVVRELRGERL